MPTYEYECTVCGHTFEKFQSIMDKSLRNCPVCRKKVRRLISGGTALIFKGSGFYITDYRSKDYKAKASQDSPKKEIKSSLESSKKDTKSDSKKVK